MILHHLTCYAAPETTSSEWLVLWHEHSNSPVSKEVAHKVNTAQGTRSFPKSPLLKKAPTSILYCLRTWKPSQVHLRHSVVLFTSPSRGGLYIFFMCIMKWLINSNGGRVRGHTTQHKNRGIGFCSSACIARLWIASSSYKAETIELQTAIPSPPCRSNNWGNGNELAGACKQHYTRINHFKHCTAMRKHRPERRTESASLLLFVKQHQCYHKNGAAHTTRMGTGALHQAPAGH